jgi:hypothetical protein
LLSVVTDYSSAALAAVGDAVGRLHFSIATPRAPTAQERRPLGKNEGISPDAIVPRGWDKLLLSKIQELEEEVERLRAELGGEINGLGAEVTRLQAHKHEYDTFRWGISGLQWFSIRQLRKMEDDEANAADDLGWWFVQVKKPPPDHGPRTSEPLDP